MWTADILNTVESLYLTAISTEFDDVWYTVTDSGCLILVVRPDDHTQLIETRSDKPFRLLS